MATKNAKQMDTSWAAIDSTEGQIFRVEIMDFHGAGLDSDEQEQTFSKADFEHDLRKK